MATSGVPDFLVEKVTEELKKARDTIDSFGDISKKVDSNGNNLAMQLFLGIGDGAKIKLTVSSMPVYVYLFSKGLNFNAVNNNGETLVIIIVKSKIERSLSYDLLEYLHKKGADFNIKDKSGSSAGDYISTCKSNLEANDRFLINRFFTITMKEDSNFKLKYFKPTEPLETLLKCAEQEANLDAIPGGRGNWLKDPIITGRMGVHPWYDQAAKRYNDIYNALLPTRNPYYKFDTGANNNPFASQNIPLADRIKKPVAGRRKSNKNSKKLRRTRRH